MNSLGHYIDRVADFDRLTQKEQVKLLAYFYIQSSGKEDFTSGEIKKSFEDQDLTNPANVTHELNKLNLQKPQILLKKGNVYSFQRSAKKELGDIYSNLPPPSKNLELYNCYVRIGEKKQIIPTVDRGELERMFLAIKDCKERVLINGRYVEIGNFDSFKIYDFSLHREIISKGEARRQMELEKNILGMTWSISVFKKFGVDVTDKFEIPEDSRPEEKNGHDYFVDKGRLAELTKISDPNFDLTRLLRKCEELNSNFASSSFFSTALLVRSIIDHVPPIFGKANFSEVAGAYGTKSFKDSMTHLDKSSRKIADAFLHTHIRSKEVLPNKTQVNFSRDLDVLLAEIVRILKI